MGTPFHDAVVSVNADLPLSSRRLVPEALDTSRMLDHQGLPMNSSVAFLKQLDEVLLALHRKTSKRCNRSYKPVAQSAAQSSANGVPTLADKSLVHTKEPVMSMFECYQGIPLDSDGHPAFEWHMQEVSPFTSPTPSLTDPAAPAEEHNEHPAKQDVALPPLRLPQALATQESYCLQYSSELDPDSSSSSISSALLYLQDLPPTSSFLTFEDDSPPTTPAHIDTTVQPSYFATDAHQCSSLPAIEELPALEAALRPSGPGCVPPEGTSQLQHTLPLPSRIPRNTSAPKLTSRIPSPRTAHSAPLSLASTSALPEARSARAMSSTSLERRLRSQPSSIVAPGVAVAPASAAASSAANMYSNAPVGGPEEACVGASQSTEACVVASQSTEAVSDSYAPGKTQRLLGLRQKAKALAAAVAGSLRRLTRSGPL